MTPTKVVLPNGIRVITTPMPSLESATVTVWVGVGSKWEEASIAGISHFTEHMVFKGSQKRPSAKLISEAVDEIGGEFNADTSKERTTFYIKARAGELSTSFDVLSDMVLNPILDPVEIDKEKGVIIEEMAMYEDTPMYRVGEVFEQLIFDGTILGPDIIGNQNSVKSISKNDFLRYRDTHYYAENIIVTVAGGIKEEDVLELSNKHFSGVKSATNKPKKQDVVINQTKPKLKLVSKKNEQAHLVLGFLGNKKDHPDKYKEAVLATILGGGMSSRIWLEVRERRGLAYSVQTDTDHYLEAGYISTYAGVEVSKIDDAIKVILDQYYGLAHGTYPIEQKELSKAKEFLKGHIALSLEDTRRVNRFFGEDEMLLGKFDKIQDIYNGIDEVTADEIVTLAQKITVPNGLNLAIIGPYEDSQRFEDLLK